MPYDRLYSSLSGTMICIRLSAYSRSCTTSTHSSADVCLKAMQQLSSSSNNNHTLFAAEIASCTLASMYSSLFLKLASHPVQAYGVRRYQRSNKG